MADVPSVSIYGDSIMKAMTPDEGFHYRSLSAALIDKVASHVPMKVRNRSRFGSTIAQGYQRLEKDLASGVEDTYVLVEYGGNDCDFDWEAVSASPDEDHDPKTPLPVFTQTLTRMTRMLRDAGKRPALMTLPPIEASRYLAFISRNGLSAANILHWLGDCQMIYRFQELYSDTIREIAYGEGLPLIDVRSRLLSRHDYSELISRDGIHPSPAGYEIIFGTFSDFLEGREGFARV